MTSHMERQVVALSEGSIAVRTLIRTYTLNIDGLVRLQNDFIIFYKPVCILI